MAFLPNSQAQSVAYLEKWIIYPNTMARGSQRRGAHCSCIGCIILGPALCTIVLLTLFYFTVHFSKQRVGFWSVLLLFLSGPLKKRVRFMDASNYTNNEDNYTRLINFLSQISKLSYFNVLDLDDFMMQTLASRFVFLVLIQPHTCLQYVLRFELRHPLTTARANKLARVFWL